MVRRRLSELQKREQAAQGALRTIARGGRPLYRISAAPDGSWRVDWCPWLRPTATDRREALAEAWRRIAEWLEVAPDAVDVDG